MKEQAHSQNPESRSQEDKWLFMNEWLQGWMNEWTTIKEKWWGTNLPIKGKIIKTRINAHVVISLNLDLNKQL